MPVSLSKNKPAIAVAGAGVSGLLFAIDLLKAGIGVTVLESRPRGFITPGWISTIDRGLFLKYMNRAPYNDEIAGETSRNHIVSPRGNETYEVADEKLYHLHFHRLYENLLKEFNDLGGRIYYRVPLDSPRFKADYSDGKWNICWRRRLRRHRLKAFLLADATGFQSPFRTRFALEKDRLVTDPWWMCRVLYGEYKPKGSWSRPPANERYSIILRHNSYSLQQYHYSKSESLLKMQIGVLRRPDSAPSVMALKQELMRFLSLNHYDTQIEQYRDISIRHSATALASDGYIMLGDTAFLNDSQRASGLVSAMVSAALAAKTVIYIDRGKLSFNYHNLHAYTHEYMKSRGLRLLELHALVRLAMNFSRGELEILFQKGFIGLHNITSLFSEDSRVSNSSYFFKRLFPVIKNPRFSYKLAGMMKPYYAFRDHLEEFPYFPEKNELLAYADKTALLLDKIYKA